MRTSVLFIALVALISAVSATQSPESQEDSQLLARDFEELYPRSKAIHSPRITYYGGSQLKNPACGGPNPSSGSMIAAVKKGGAFKCGDTLHISKGGRIIKVKVIDHCAACSDKAVDLTAGAFRKLTSLSDGVITGARIWKK